MRIDKTSRITLASSTDIPKIVASIVPFPLSLGITTARILVVECKFYRPSA